MASVITEAITEAMEDVVAVKGALDWDSAQAIAEKFDVKARAIVASATRAGMAYKRKERVSKTGEKVVSKADLVAQIAEARGLDVAALDGLEKATKTALQALIGA